MTIIIKYMDEVNTYQAVFNGSEHQEAKVYRTFGIKGDKEEYGVAIGNPNGFIKSLKASNNMIFVSKTKIK